MSSTVDTTHYFHFKICKVKDSLTEVKIAGLGHINRRRGNPIEKIILYC